MRLSHIYIMLVTVALVMASSPQEADACSCGADLRSFPANGSIDVPLNVRPTFFAPSSEAAPDTSFSLRIAGQLGVTQVPATWRSRERFGDQLIVLEPVEPLAPMTSYEVLAGDSAVVLSFQTGQQLDVEPPGPTPIKSLSVEVMEGNSGNTCVDDYDGFFGRLRIEYPDLPEDAAYYIVQMRSVEGEHWTDDWILLSRAWELEPLAISDLLCGPRPQILRPGQGYCASLVAVDLAGNVSASQELCATAKECRYDLTADGYPSERCDIGARNAFGCSVVQSSEQRAVYFLIGLFALCWRRRKRQGAAGSAASGRTPSR